jgi:hypothetical protein
MRLPIAKQSGRNSEETTSLARFSPPVQALNGITKSDMPANHLARRSVESPLSRSAAFAGGLPMEENCQRSLCPCFAPSLFAGLAFVAIAGSALHWTQVRRERFQEKYVYHDARSRDGKLAMAALMFGYLQQDGSLSSADVSASELERVNKAKALIAWHRSLAEKYRLAAERPWLPVAEDPHAPGRNSVAVVRPQSDILAAASG